MFCLSINLLDRKLVIESVSLVKQYLKILCPVFFMMHDNYVKSFQALMAEINLNEDLVYYFGLFLIKRADDGEATSK